MTTAIRVTKREAAAYFKKPPDSDLCTIELNGRHVDVLACPIDMSPTYPSMRAAMDMMAAERRKDDRLRNSQVFRTIQDRAIDYADGKLDPVLHPWAFHQLPEPIRPAPGAQPDVPSKRARKFSPADMRGDPLRALTRDQRQGKIDVYRHAAKMMCQESDWDEQLLIAGPKIIDQLLYMSERLVYGVEEKLKETADKLKALSRQTMGDEIPIQQIERLERQMAGFLVQKRHFELMQFAFRQERDPIVEASGIDWPRYEGIKQRAERSAGAWRDKNRRRSSLSMVIENMSDAEYARWVDNTRRYEPKHNGVDASDEDATDTRAPYEE